MKVYSQEIWWSDKWDGRDYGRDFDFSRPFFDQFQELRLSTPRMSLLNSNGENSEYCNLTTDNKNCYLVFGEILIKMLFIQYFVFIQEMLRIFIG